MVDFELHYQKSYDEMDTLLGKIINVTTPNCVEGNSNKPEVIERSSEVTLLKMT